MASPLKKLFKTHPSLTIPTHFRCPISLDLMKDPVTLSTGITYDRQSIETWLDDNNHYTCPVTNQLLTNLDLTPNHTIRKMIQDWCVAHKNLGIDRIPTPRAPVTPTQVSDMLADIELATWRNDGGKVLELVTKIKKLAKESERNRKCISSNGCAKVLAIAFSRFGQDGHVCSEILLALTAMLPLDRDACRQILAPDAIRSLVSILKSGDLISRLNAVLIIKEIATVKDHARTLSGTEGLIEAIMTLIKEPISPRTTKASLAAIYYLVNSSSQRAVSRFVDLDIVSLMLETALDSEKSVAEKALVVLDSIFDSQKGRETAYSNALTMPVLVKKMFRVSETATEFSVSAIWKVFKNCDERNRRVLAEEALGVGAFQKLLLLLQLGCGEGIKEKASDMLRMLNAWRGEGECIESGDFKGLKRNL